MHGARVEGWVYYIIVNTLYGAWVEEGWVYSIIMNTHFISFSLICTAIGYKTMLSVTTKHAHSVSFFIALNRLAV